MDHTLQLDDLPVAAELPQGRTAVSYGGFYRDPASRRSFLMLTVRVAALVGLVTLGLFRSVRRAYGAVTYTEHVNASNPRTASACGNYDPDTWFGNDGNQNGFHEPGECTDDACVGASDAEMGNSFCVKCNEVSANNPYGWHFVGFRGQRQYGDHSNVCTVNGVNRDAWRWKINNCAGCNTAVFRCHDGWKRDPNEFHDLTVCQALVYCNGTLHTC